MSNIFSKWFASGSSSQEDAEKRMVQNTEGTLSINEASFLRALGIDPVSVTVSATSAMGISTFYSAVRLISDLIATQPYSVFKSLDGGGSEIAKTHRLHYLLHTRPNSKMSSYVFRRTMVANMLVYGFAVARILRDGSGNPAALIPHPSSKVEIYEDDVTGMNFFKLIRKDGTIEVVLSEDEVIFIKDLGFDGNCGHSIVKWQYKTLKLDHLTREYADKYYGKNAFISGVITTELEAKDGEAAAIYKQRIIDGIKSDGSGVAVLGRGVDYKPVSRGPVESQVIEFLNQSDKDIAKFFGLPLAILGDTEKQTSFGTGVEQSFIGITNTVIIPKAVQIEQEINYKCLTDKEIQSGYYTKINFRNLLRGDSKGYAEFIGKMIQNGVYSQNEVRAWDEMPAIEGGNENWIQINMMRLKDADKNTTSDGKGITVPTGVESDN